MKTIYDWITVGIFAGLIVLFLQRSVDPAPVRDSMWQYLAASVGCAVANWLGNHEYNVAAIIVIAVVLGYVWYALKPLSKPPE